MVEDENGNIVRETMKDNDVLQQYKTMRETLIYLCHLDYEDTENQMLDKLRMQVRSFGARIKHRRLLPPAFARVAAARGRRGPPYSACGGGGVRRPARALALDACHTSVRARLLLLCAQLSGGKWTWQGLNTLCWAIGSISGSMQEEQENRFLVTVIRWGAAAGGAPCGATHHL